MPRTIRFNLSAYPSMQDRASSTHHRCIHDSGFLGRQSKRILLRSYPGFFAEVSDFVRRRLKWMQLRPKLIRAFWQQTELAL